MYNYCGREAIRIFEDKRFLSAKEILEKDFKIDAKGYRPQEVDQFLDLIIKDYLNFEINNSKINSKNRKL